MTAGKLATALLVMALAVTGCGDGVRQGISRALPQDVLGACPEETMEGPDPFEWLASPGAWVRVENIAFVPLPTDPTFRTTEHFTGTYRVLGGDSVWVSRLGTPTSLRMHGSIAHAAATSLGLGAEVYAHVGAMDDPQYVHYAYALLDGEYAFLGECQDLLLTKPVAHRFGPRAEIVLRIIAGRESSSVAGLVDVTRSTTPPLPPVLNPDYTSPTVLANLREALFTIDPVPASWLDTYTLCTKIVQGWNDCVDLASEESAEIEVNMYYDPKNPDVEIWLLDHDATLTQPIAKLGVADVGDLASRSNIDHQNRHVKLRLDLEPTVTPDEIAADSTQAAQAVADLVLSVL